MAKGIFVTGTGTDVGKTYVTARLVKWLREQGVDVAYYKAALSGNERDEDGRLIPGDAKHVKEVSGISQTLDSMCPYVYENAVSPHLAARLEGNPPRLDVIREGYDRLAAEHEFVVVEGSGGIICPLRQDQESELWLEDVIRELELPALIVGDGGLGTINAVMLTWHYAKAKGIPVEGILLNRFRDQDVMHQDNAAMIEGLTGEPLLATLAADGEALQFRRPFLLGKKSMEE